MHVSSLRFFACGKRSLRQGDEHSIQDCALDWTADCALAIGCSYSRGLRAPQNLQGLRRSRAERGLPQEMQGLRMGGRDRWPLRMRLAYSAAYGRSSVVDISDGDFMQPIAMEL